MCGQGRGSVTTLLHEAPAGGRGRGPRERAKNNDVAMVRIRLKRIGTTNTPAFRIVVADNRSPRDGKFIEGTGHVFAAPKERQLHAQSGTRRILGRSGRAALRDSVEHDEEEKGPTGGGVGPATPPALYATLSGICVQGGLVDHPEAGDHYAGRPERRLGLRVARPSPRCRQDHRQAGQDDQRDSLGSFRPGAARKASAPPWSWSRTPRAPRSGAGGFARLRPRRGIEHESRCAHSSFRRCSPGPWM